MSFRNFVLFYCFCVLFFNPVLSIAQSKTKTSSSLSPDTQGLLQNLASEQQDASSQSSATSSILKANFDLSNLSQNVANINVHVVGDVQQAGTYKVPVGTRLSLILQSAKPKRPTFRFVRIKGDQKTITVDFYHFVNSGSLSENPFLQENDVVNVLNFSKAIKIGGPISRPGVYEIGPEKTVEDIIRLAGGLTSIYNDTLPINIVRFDSAGKQNVIEISRNETKTTAIKPNDVIVVQSPLNQDTKFDYSLETLPGEDAFYPTSKAEIYIAGAVLAPGAYPYKQFLTVKDYIGVAGVNDNAKLRNPKLIRNNKITKVSMEDRLNPGDMVVVHKKDLSKLTTGLSLLSSILGVTLTTIILNDKLN